MADKYLLDLKGNQIVLYADIIGFKNLIRQNENELLHKEQKALMVNFIRIYEIVTKEKFSRENQQKLGIKFLWASDSIFISCDKDNVSNLHFAVNELINQLFSAGLVLRGGISVGKLCHKDNIWGSCLLNAIDLEKKALYPRIIIEKEDLAKILEIDKHFVKYYQLTEDKKYYYYDNFAFLSEQISKNINICASLCRYSKVTADNFNSTKIANHLEKWEWLAKELINFINDYLKEIHDKLDEQEAYDIYSGNRITSPEMYIEILKKCEIKQNLQWILFKAKRLFCKIGGQLCRRIH